MKKLLSLIVALLVLFSLNPAVARKARSTHYLTYEVVQLIENVIVLQSPAGEKLEIDKARRPELQIGDRVRYAKTKDRLGVTLSPGGPDEPEGEED